ncbi:unnamed protein product, partial [Ceratitis capitata]
MALMPTRLNNLILYFDDVTFVRRKSRFLASVPVMPSLSLHRTSFNRALMSFPFW